MTRYAVYNKLASRTGPFKQAFSNQFVFVYGTQGTPEENAATLAKVRYDAELWYVRGNGSVDIVRDLDFSSDPPQPPTGRNVILYGNATTNARWNDLLKDCPIHIGRGEIEVNGRKCFTGDDLAVLFCYPRKDTNTALVGVVGSTGVIGTRLATRLPYFSSTGFPDWCVLDPTILSTGLSGAKAAGYFDNDWKFNAASSAFSK